MRKDLVVLAAALLIGGCSMAKDASAAGQAVVQFHHQLDAGRYDAIYESSAPEMKASSPEPSFVRLMDAIHRKLGPVQAATQQGWRVNYNNGAGTVTLSYQTRFAKGSGTETFVYRTGASPTLIGYNINSPDLIAN